MPPRVGIVCWWFNRGQATVGRFLRSALEATGHETFVLARPTKDRFDKPRFIDTTDVWAQDGVTHASHFRIPGEEYLEWARVNRLDAVLFDQNYQFEEIAALRAEGVRTIGRFVWETFGAEHVADARAALDTVYAVTRCEQARYADLGLAGVPYLRFGCHPELVADPTPRGADAPPVFFYPGGYLSDRKPTGAVVEAFRRAAVPGARLIIKDQRPLRLFNLVLPATVEALDAARRDEERQAEAAPLLERDVPGVTVVTDDLPTEAYLDLLHGCDVMLAPSRWEGLGLHLFEATAAGMPIVCNDMAPLDEIAVDGRNAILSRDHVIGVRPNGLPVHEPDVEDLARAIREAADPARRADLAAGARARRAELDWRHTETDLAALVAGAPVGAPAG